MIYSISKSEERLLNKSDNYSTGDQMIDESTPPLRRRGIERLDMLFLVLESLDLNTCQAMLWTSQKLGLGKYLPNRVEIWKLRCFNHLRRAPRPGNLSPQHSEALIHLVCAMSDRVYPQIHQLLSSREPEFVTEKRWKILNDRLRDLINERMNNQLIAVKRLLLNNELRQLSRDLVLILALSAGPGGVDRLRASLLDQS